MQPLAAVLVCERRKSNLAAAERERAHLWVCDPRGAQHCFARHVAGEAACRERARDYRALCQRGEDDLGRHRYVRAKRDPHGILFVHSDELGVVVSKV
jgi:hypothetical protein